MRKLMVFAIVGFFAQLIDGSMGMGYGATSSSLLLTFGVAPAIASASIHISEIATTGASGLSHLHFKNVDKGTVYRLIAPGAIGAFAGAAVLSSIPGNVIKPYVSLFLLSLGVYIVWKFIGRQSSHSGKRPASSVILLPQALIAGFFDAIGGGGWGPINTPLLLSRKGAEPRKVIGSVDTSEFFVTLSASLGFIIFLGWAQVSWFWVGAFVLGGVLAAPLAAWLVKIIPTHLLGILVGGFIILTNLRTFLQLFDIPSQAMLGLYIILLVIWGAAISFVSQKNKKSYAGNRRVTVDMEN